MLVESFGAVYLSKMIAMEVVEPRFKTDQSDPMLPLGGQHVPFCLAH